MGHNAIVIERLLQLGWVSPYFIWPNINPFRRAGSVEAAVPASHTAADIVERESALRNARRSTQQARHDGRGMYGRDPLGLLPFELRYVSQRQPPDRWVVDLGHDDDQMLPSQAYFEIPKPEDRLFVPPEYVPLWERHGWRRG